MRTSVPAPKPRASPRRGALRAIPARATTNEIPAVASQVATHRSGVSCARAIQAAPMQSPHGHARPPRHGGERRRALHRFPDEAEIVHGTVVQGDRLGRWVSQGTSGVHAQR